VLDGAVLVVSAVEGVQPQTRVLMRTLRRLRIPTLVFVNKLDRGGADLDRTLRDIAARLTPDVVAMTAASGLGTRAARVAPYTAGQPAFTDRLVDLLAGHDDRLLADYVADERAVPYERLRAELAAQTGQALVHPVYAGSAVTGAGVDALIAGVRELLPVPEGDPDGPLSGTVFKIERGQAGRRSRTCGSPPARYVPATGRRCTAAASRRSRRTARTERARQPGESGSAARRPGKPRAPGTRSPRWSPARTRG